MPLSVTAALRMLPVCFLLRSKTHSFSVKTEKQQQEKKKELFPGLWACGHLNLSFTVLPEWGSPYPAMHSALALPLVSGPLHLPDLGSEVKVSAQLTSLCSWALEELGWLVSGQWDSVPYLLGWELVLSDVARG